ncbi:MAG: 8-oxo-dGTP diphosphatase [Flavobacteriales bacterium]|jgi:8-oxo-dGTP diphosphatase|tara:strand:+ start:1937 stop:2332 length:396 start_codon:yes stop_codon:yes gene_type:complete
MKKVEVVAAILINDNKILCVQRAESKLPYISKKFEFPGGKIETGETQKEALQRELVEELDINVTVDDLYLTVNHQYPDFELTMHSFIVNIESRKLTLNEHIDQKWLLKEELTALDWAAADLPIVHKLINND